MGTLGLVVAVSVLLAGCTGSPNLPASVTTSDAAMVPIVKDAAGNALARFGVERAVSQTIWANGTFKADESFFPLQLVPVMAGLPLKGIHTTPITDAVPKGVPVRITSEVHADVTDGDVDLWLNIPFDEMWAGTWDTPPGGYSKIETRIVHLSDDPLGVSVGYAELDHQPEFTYTLRIDVTYDPEALVDSVGATLDVPVEGARLLVDAAAGGPDAALLVWGPDKKLVDRFALQAGANEIQLAAAGQHLLLLAQGSGDATLAIDGVSEPPRLGHAKQEIVDFMGESQGPKVTWSFDADRAPIQVGFFANSGTVASDFSGLLTSPKGRLIESHFTGGPWVRPVMGFGAGEWTAMGGKNLVAGKYDFEISFSQNAGPDPIHYGHWFVFMSAP